MSQNEIEKHLGGVIVAAFVESIDDQYGSE